MENARETSARETNARDMTRRGFLRAIGAGSILGAATLLAACGSTSSEDSGADASSSDASSSDSTADSTEGTAASGDHKVLVAYFSATGNTRAVAETLASTLGADIFEIVPTEPYTDDDLNFNEEDSRVSREHEDESLRDVPLAQSAPENFADYDTVLLGYPIWWAIAAWPTNHFVSDNDLSGKTIIPFCTSQSSGLGRSAENLQELDGAGTWQEGQRFAQHPDDSEVQSWAASLGL